MKYFFFHSFFCLSIFLTGQDVQFSFNNRQIFGTHEERTASMSMGDIDQDGDIDVVIANGRHWPGQNRIFINNGFGKFTVSKPLGEESATSYSTELADFDGDGDLDIAVGNDMAPNALFMNDGAGNFSKSGTFGDHYAPTRNIIVADIDMDGDQDILITNRGKENEICLNDGAGNFKQTIGFGTRDDSTIDVEVADIDMDGDQDLILANRDEQPNYVYLQSGNLNFIEKIPFGSGVDNTRSVAVSDINNDGYLDIITANIEEPNKIYFGNEMMTFTESMTFDTSYNQSSSISLSDFNLDGLVDIVIGNFHEPNKVFINKNNGAEWEEIVLSNFNSFTYDVIAGDLNMDGLPDIIESNSDEVNRFYFNNFKDPALKHIIPRGSFLVYRRQSLIGEENYQIETQKDSIFIRSLQGENERGRITGVQSILKMDKHLFAPVYYSATLNARGGMTNIFKMEKDKDHVTILEKHFDKEEFNASEVFFPLHSNISASAEMMLYHYYFRFHEAGQELKTLPRGSLKITHRGQDKVTINGEDELLDRYVVEGINWGGRTIWLDKHKNLIAIVKANTQIREVIRQGYEDAMPIFIAGNVEEQMAALSTYTKENKRDQASILALVGGDVIDGVDKEIKKNQVVIIENGKIKTIGPKSKISIPSTAQVIDVNDKTLIPGLWDMHAHSNQVQWAPAYLAGGVTTIRDNGNEIEFATAFRDAIAQKGMLGPDIILAGMTDGPGAKGNGIVRARTPEEAREVVDRYVKLGYKQIKIYNSVEPEILKVITEEAHKKGVTVTGHIPDPVGTTQDAVELGMDMFSHDRAIASLLYPDMLKAELPDLMTDDLSLDPERIKRATEFLLEHRIVLDPTMNLRVIMALEEGKLIETLEPDAYRMAYELWEGKRFRSGNDSESVQKDVKRYTKILQAIGEFHEAGVPIVAGTDNAVPVFSLYLEMETYHKFAGLTPLEALQSATIIPAKVMGMEEETGSIEIGKQADIAILDKNPLEDISNIRTVSATITNGQYYESNALWKAADFLPRKN